MYFFLGEGVRLEKVYSFEGNGNRPLNLKEHHKVINALRAKMFYYTVENVNI